MIVFSFISDNVPFPYRYVVFYLKYSGGDGVPSSYRMKTGSSFLKLHRKMSKLKSCQN